MTAHAQFSIGDLVHHKLFDYRGVVFDVDPRLMLSEEWYEAVARSRPPKDQPWYRVLVHDAIHETRFQRVKDLADYQVEVIARGYTFVS